MRIKAKTNQSINIDSLANAYTSFISILFDGGACDAEEQGRNINDGDGNEPSDGEGIMNIKGSNHELLDTLSSLIESPVRAGKLRNYGCTKHNKERRDEIVLVWLKWQQHYDHRTLVVPACDKKAGAA